jgi:hypothetical protein
MALKKHYPAFKEIFAKQEFGALFLTADSPDRPTEDGFEMEAASAKTFENLVFKFMVVGAMNQ